MANAVQNVIDYHTPHPRELTLEEGEGSVRVLFPLPPQWLRVFAIVAPLVYGFAAAGAGIVFVAAMWKLTRATPWTTVDKVMGVPHVILKAILTAGIVVTAFFTAAAYQWWWFSRYGGLRRTLIASISGLTVIRPGRLRQRERTWPASEILSIELRPLWGNLNRRTPSADLYVHLRKPKLVRFRLTSKDIELPGRIAKGMASAIGCAVKIPSLSFAGEIANLKGKNEP